MIQTEDGTYWGGPAPMATRRAAPWRGAVGWLGQMAAAPARFVRRLFGGSEEDRSIRDVPWNQGGVLGGGNVSAERALQLVPLFACIRLLSDNIASLPLQAFRRTGDQRQPLDTAPLLLRDPAAIDDSFQWIHKAVVSLALRGNAYGLVTRRDGMGFPSAVEWVHPDEVSVDETIPTAPVYFVLGTIVPRESIVHIPWMVQPGRVKGLSPLAAFAATIGVGIEAMNYGRSWFEGGGHPPATMRNTQKTIKSDDADEIANRLVRRMRERKPLVYGSDWEFTALNVTPEESQFVETMRLNATQIAVIYGIPPEKVGGESGGSLTYSTVESNQLALATDVLRPWMVRLERAISALLPEPQFVRFNADAAIRMNTLDRYNSYRIALQDGWRNVDEVRALEDLPPLPDGQGQQYQVPRGELPAIPEDRLNGHALAHR